jgi:hypothetical protein
MLTTQAPHAAAVQRWISDFVLRPHPELGRSGAVCPFVEPAIVKGTLLMRERPLASPVTLDQVIAALRCGVREFRQTAWTGNRILHTMLVIFPLLAEHDAALLDDAHAELKDELVRQDIMMAPFHPQCAEPAARNPNLLTFRAPVPMVAVRRLAFHDILFLFEKKEWFFHYASKYGCRYRDPAALDPEYVRRYRAGLDAFGDPQAA